MREIKFRAWDKAEKKMVYNPVFTPCNCKPQCPIELNFMLNNDKDFIYMECLGNFNGQDVYQGDYITTPQLMGIWEIIYESPLFKLKSISDMQPACLIQRKGQGIEDKKSIKGSIIGFSLILANECKVIGNIYENQELMK